MNESYIVEKLIIGNIFSSTNLGRTYGPVNMTSNEKYIFYKKRDDVAVEVFTDDEFIMSDDNYEFNKNYIVNKESILSYLSEDEKRLGTVMKWRLIEIYNKINFQNEKNKSKLKKI